MTVGRFLAGIPLGLLALVPIGLAARAWRQLLLPSWKGLEARLVEIVLALAAITVVTEMLGTVGWFTVGAVTAGLALVGAGGWLLARHMLAGRIVRSDPVTAEGPARPDGERSASEQPANVFTWQVAAAAAAMFLVAAAWSARTIRAIGRGMTTVDTLWYHLPFAVRYVQTGRVGSIHYVDEDPVTAFFPATSSLFHGIGILTFGTDLFSTVINLGWLALALAAAWCIGRPFGAAPVAALGAAIMLATPGLVATQPGGAYNDVAGLALLLTAIAVVVQDRFAERAVGQDIVVGLAAGLALGMKFTFVFPAVALCLAVALTATKGLRVRRTVIIVLSACVSGGYWYARNAIVAHNPLPSLDLSAGPLTLPSVKGALPTSTVAKFLFDGRAWTDTFVPGLRSSLGPAWVAVVALALVGLIAAIAQRSEPRVRMLGVVGLASVAAYVVTPQYLVGAFGRPLFFSANLRYASPGLVIGLALLPVVLRRWLSWVLGAYVLVLVATALDPTTLPTGFGWAVFQDRVRGGDTAVAGLLLVGLAALVAGVIQISRHGPSTVRAAVTGTAVPVVLVLGLACAHGRYLDQRYENLPPYPKVFAWARQIHDARIAAVGLFMQNQYALAGLDLSNYVQFAGVRVGRGGFRPPATCAEWVGLLEAGRYDYVVVAPAKNLAEWTAAQPDARLALTEPLGKDGSAAVEVYRLQPSQTPRTCR